MSGWNQKHGRNALVVMKGALLAALWGGASIANATGTPAVPVYVDTFATSGNGSVSSPWTGWDSAITWQGSVPYTFRAGVYAFATPPAGWSQASMQLLGVPGAVLKCTSCGTGAVLPIVDPDGGYPLDHVRVENFTIDGNGTAAKGVFLNRVTRSSFNNLRVVNVTQTGFHLTLNVLNTFYDPKVTDATAPGLTSMPLTAMLIDGESSANTIVNPIFEGHEINGSVTPANAVGIKLAGRAVQNVFVGGSVEGLTKGIVLCADTADTDCSRNTFSGIDLEANSGADITLDAGNSNQFNNVLAASTGATPNVDILSRARNNQFVGGAYTSIRERGQNNTFMNLSLSAYDATHFDSYLINTALVNVGVANTSETYNRMPANTLIGQMGSGLSAGIKGFNNGYTLTTDPIALWAPASVPGIVETSIYTDSRFTAAVSAGASVSVGLVDALPPSNFMLSGYVDPADPTRVKIRWTQISGPATAPPTAKYKITVFQ